jgi:acyl carrier protein
MATSQLEIASMIEKFIRRQFRIISSDNGTPFSRDAHLFESGYVDSAGVVELIVFVESTFNVKLQDEHVFSEQFTTVNGITDIVMTCEAKPDELRAAVR